MGAAMAANLIPAGYEVRAWNRSAQAAAPPAAAGAIAASSIAEACDADIVISMLADDPAVEAVAWGQGGVIAARPPVHISMSTISVALADRLEQAHHDGGTRFVSAPVLGRPAVARVGALTIVAAGAAQAVDLCRPVFDVLGKRLCVVGERPSAANLVKLCNNFMVVAAIEALAEAVTLARKGGVSPELLVELAGVVFPGPVHETYGRLMAARDFAPPGFAAALGLKDVELVAAAAKSLRVPMPALAVVREHLVELLAQDGGELDWAAILLPIERAAGLAPAVAGPLRLP
jgi:3-hydroxyisobutyrate dehydrogenase-like beta-hydroxyacid dehydrogenase